MSLRQFGSLEVSEYLDAEALGDQDIQPLVISGMQALFVSAIPDTSHNLRNP